MRAFAAHWGKDAVEKESRIVVIDTSVSALDGELYLVVNSDEHVSWQRGYPRFVAFCETSESVLRWIRYGRTGD